MSVYLAGKEFPDVVKYLKRRNVPARHHEALARLAAPTINERYYRLVGNRTNMKPRNIIRALAPHAESSAAGTRREARVRQLITQSVQQAAWKKAQLALQGTVNIIPPKESRSVKVAETPRPVVQNEGYGIFEDKPVQKGPRGGFFIKRNDGSIKRLPKYR